MGPEFSAEALAQIEKIAARYPRRQASLLPVLHLAQEEFGHLALPVQALIAKTLGVPATLVHEVATFYEMFHEHSEGQCHLEVCTNIACHLSGADRLVEHLERKLGIKVGHQTTDGVFGLIEAECLASCGSGPMMRVGMDYYEYVTPEAADALIDRLRKIALTLDGKAYRGTEPEPHVGPVPGFAPTLPEGSEALPAPEPPSDPKPLIVLAPKPLPPPVPAPIVPPAPVAPPLPPPPPPASTTPVVVSVPAVLPPKLPSRPADGEPKKRGTVDLPTFKPPSSSG
ncbi:MAG: NADH-quinone oxidoreductase subunit NuoE [Deltaproteobacteria bacterium]|nr:NADH-quinone oxidoreductase subunit NuoE [Deltaproteobacteria bacterium]